MGYRWWYYLSGLPGWLRFGYSPGWGGLPPAAQYLYETGQMPQFYQWLQERSGYAYPFYPYPGCGYGYGYSYGFPAGMPGGPTPLSREQEIKLLEDQAKALEEQLEQIRERLKELEREEKREEK